MKDSTHAALTLAAERIGLNNYRSGLHKHLKAGRVRNTYRYTPTAEHEAIIKALNEDWPDDDAMALLHGYETLKQRGL